MKLKLSALVLAAALFVSTPSFAGVVEGATAVADTTGNVLVLLVKGTVDVVKAVTITPAKKVVEVVAGTATEATSEVAGE